MRGRCWRVQLFSRCGWAWESLRSIEHPTRDVVVVIPDLVVAHAWQRILHNNRGSILRTMLRLRGDGRVVVVNTPFYLHDG